MKYTTTHNNFAYNTLIINNWIFVAPFFTTFHNNLTHPENPNQKKRPESRSA